MLPSKEEKAYIISYCKTSGSGNSACLKCDEEDHQPNCSFFEKGSFNKRCFHIRMGEYCSNFYACDFADGKDVDIKNIPNMPKLSRSREFIDTPYGRKEIYQDGERYVTKKIMRSPSFSFPSDMRRKYKGESGPGPMFKHREKRRTYHDVDGTLRYEDTGDKVLQTYNPCQETIMKEVDLSGRMSDIMGEYEKLEDEMEKFPVLNDDGTIGFVTVDAQKGGVVPIAVDNSGSMTPEKFHELAGIVAETLRDQTICIFKPVTDTVTMDHLYECMDTYCGAYSEKFNLWLDMSDPNLYTIYTAGGNFMSLRKLLEDGITPFQMNFKMLDGSSCFKEYGFEEFVDMIEPMLAQGR